MADDVEALRTIALHFHSRFVFLRDAQAGERADTLKAIADRMEARLHLIEEAHAFIEEANLTYGDHDERWSGWRCNYCNSKTDCLPDCEKQLLLKRLEKA